MDKRVSKKYLNNLVNKIISETIEDRTDELVSKIKTNVNELGGMEDGHPRFGKKKFTDMSDEEIDNLINNYGDSDEDGDEWSEIDSEDEDMEGNWVHPLGESEIDDLMNSEVDEQFDSEELKKWRKDKPFSRREFKGIPKGANINTDNLRDDSITPNKYMKNKFDDIDDLLRKHFGDDDDDGGDDDDLVYENEMEACEQCGGQMNEGECMECGNMYEMMNENEIEACEQCGGQMNEGECMECGTSYGSMDEDEVLGDEEDKLFDKNETQDTNVEGCKTVKDVIKTQGGKMTDLDKDLIKRYNCESLNENLTGKQRRGLDKNKNNKIDTEDFKLLRKGKKSETKEGSKPDFLDLDKDGDRKEPMKSAAKKKKIKESLRLTEAELIGLIENIVKQSGLKKIGGEPSGLKKYKEVHNKDGKTNKEYLNSVSKKMKDYLKDGSKGSYEENPKHFPKGNGELEKMDKKAFSMTDDLEDFNYEIAGLNLPTPDAIEFNEDFMDDLYTGSHKTGNGPGGNAVETDVNKRFNKLRKKDTLKKLKDQSYNRVSQPVFNEKSGNDKGKGLSIKLESTEKETKILNEEFSKISRLIGYDRKTQ